MWISYLNTFKYSQLIRLSRRQSPLNQCGVKGLAQGPNSCADLFGSVVSLMGNLILLISVGICSSFESCKTSVKTLMSLQPSKVSTTTPISSGTSNSDRCANHRWATWQVYSRIFWCLSAVLLFTKCSDHFPPSLFPNTSGIYYNIKQDSLARSWVTLFLYLCVRHFFFFF